MNINRPYRPARSGLLMSTHVLVVAYLFRAIQWITHNTTTNATIKKLDDCRTCPITKELEQ